MNSVSNKPWVNLEKGDLIRNKNDGEYAVVISTFTKFFQDRSHWGSDIDYGVADTAVRIQWVVGGTEHVFQRSKMSRNWEIVCK